jgi:hypothetical protein
MRPRRTPAIHQNGIVVEGPQIVSKIREAAGQIFQLPQRTSNGFRRRVPIRAGRLAPARLLCATRVLFTRLGAEPLAVTLLDEFSNRQLPPLLRARAQLRQLPRVHAERARHLDLPRRELAELLRARPRRVVVCPMPLRHAPRPGRAAASRDSRWDSMHAFAIERTIDMSLHDLKARPPWEWPADTADRLLTTLRDEKAAGADRLLAAELAGDLVVMNDELAAALIDLLEDGRQPDEIRARAAISLGPVLEQVETDGFEDAEDLLITETTFHRIQESLRATCMNPGEPKEVRRRALEGSVRAPQRWHADAIRAAFGSADDRWTLTAIFCTRFVKGFDAEILHALSSRDPDVHYEAVVAAGAWGIGAAWPHIVDLVASESVEKALRLAAIAAVPSIRPDEAGTILGALLDSDDQEVVEAVEEALAMAEGLSDDAAWKDDEDE